MARFKVQDDTSCPQEICLWEMRQVWMKSFGLNGGGKVRVLLLMMN